MCFNVLTELFLGGIDVIKNILYDKSKLGET